MPRLLLVDDNQSIHKIAETLLTATDIELTCASSGVEALELAAAKGPFDVALLDTSMLGMDGWTLLDRLRHNEATALMPIAMMAGVLDVVDPETIRKAPIQGFLKKPVELRDLADRIRTLLATPVEPPRPEPEPEPEPVVVQKEASFATVPYIKLADHPFPPASDLLILEAGDVLEEEDAPVLPPEPTEASFRQEALPEEASFQDGLLDLDLGLAEEPMPEVVFAEEPLPEVVFAEEAVPEVVFAEEPLPEVAFAEEALPEVVFTEAPVPEVTFAEEPAPEPSVAPEPPSLETSMASGFEALELEELDLDSLKDLSPLSETGEASLPDEMPTVDDLANVPDFSAEDAIQASLPDRGIITDELPDLGPSMELPEETCPGLEAAAVDALPATPATSIPDYWSDESDTLLDLTPEPTPLDHADFGPDSFLDQDLGPEPTPAFLPEIPEDLAPVRDEAFTLDLEGLTDAPGLALEAANPPVDEAPLPVVLDTVAPWADTQNLQVEPPPTPERLEDLDRVEDLDERATLPAIPELPPAVPLAIGLTPELPPAVPLAIGSTPELPPAMPLAIGSTPELPPAMPLAIGSTPEPLAAGDPLAAVLADPALMDRLAKAVVARLSDQILRDIAWEVMPEMADRLHRN